MAQDRLGVLVKNGPRVGEDDALRAAREQLPIQLGLQAVEMMADCGLGNMQLIRSTREAAGLDNSNKVTKLADVHIRL